MEVGTPHELCSHGCLVFGPAVQVERMRAQETWVLAVGWWGGPDQRMECGEGSRGALQTEYCLLPSFSWMQRLLASLN